MVAIATIVKRTADVLPISSLKFNNPTARPPSNTVKLSHERKVRSLAKKTLGSTRVGSAMRFPGREGELGKPGGRKRNYYLEPSEEAVGLTCSRRVQGLEVDALKVWWSYLT